MKSSVKASKAETVNRNNPLRRTTRNILRRWQLYLLVLPALLYIIIFSYKPMYGIIVAFKDFSMRKGILGSPWVGFANFERLFRSPWFPVILKNTLSISLLSIVFTFPLPIILAMMVNEVKNQKLKKTFQIVSYAPHFISMVVVCSMINLFLSPSTGVLAHLVEALGGNADKWLTDTKAFKWVYILSGVWQQTGWGALIYYAALSAVDPGLLEAAEIDGANKIQRILHINLPAILPTIVIMLIMRFGQVMSVGYEKVFLLQNDLNIMGSEVISTYVYKIGLEQGDFSFSTAVGLFNSVINCILLTVANWTSKKLSGSSMW